MRTSEEIAARYDMIRKEIAALETQSQTPNERHQDEEQLDRKRIEMRARLKELIWIMNPADDNTSK